MTNNMELIQNANLILDCDEILVNISPKWSKLLLANREEFEEYLDFTELEKVKDDHHELTKLVLNREHFYLTEWLKRDDVEEIPKHIIDKFMKLYNVKDFYHDLPLTKMAVALGKLSYHPSIQKVYVVTRVTEDTSNLESKDALIKSLFPYNKLEIIKVPPKEKKSDYIKNIDIKNGFIFDDENGNLMDYLVNGKVSECNFYVPRLGYNRPSMDMLRLADEQKVSVSYY